MPEKILGPGRFAKPVTWGAKLFAILFVVGTVVLYGYLLALTVFVMAWAGRRIYSGAWTAYMLPVELGVALPRPSALDDEATL